MSTYCSQGKALAYLCFTIFESKKKPKNDFHPTEKDACKPGSFSLSPSPLFFCSNLLHPIQIFQNIGSNECIAASFFQQEVAHEPIDIRCGDGTLEEVLRFCQKSYAQASEDITGAGLSHAWISRAVIRNLVLRQNDARRPFQ